MIGRRYLALQATALLRFAALTGNPQLAAVLVEKAAKLKSQANEAPPAADLSPRAPDVEWPGK
jgi:hypothetical protein